MKISEYISDCRLYDMDLYRNEKSSLPYYNELFTVYNEKLTIYNHRVCERIRFLYLYKENICVYNVILSLYN